MDAALEKNKKRFKILRISFWLHFVWWALFFLIANLVNDDGASIAVLFLLGMVNGFVYLIMIGTLAAQARKNVALWVICTFMFNFVGVLFSYVNMKTIAIQSGWD